MSYSAKFKAAVIPLYVALCLLACVLSPVRAFAVSGAGIPITHTQATISGVASGISITDSSNILSPTTIMPVYGVSAFVEAASATQRFSQGGSVDFRFDVKNNGNATDFIIVEVYNVTYAKEDPLASPAWTIQVDDQYPFASGLTWQTSASANLKTTATTDSVAVSTGAGQTRTFTVRVKAASGALEGANVKFNVRVKTASGAKGSYVGFNGATYAGAAQYAAASQFAGEALDIQAPVLAFNATLTGTELTGKAKIYGTAKDAHFSSYSLQYGPGANPAMWKEIASSTTKVDDGLLAEWDTSSKQGTYTLKLVSTDQFGNNSVSTQSVVVGNEMTLSGALPVGEWTMVSIPGIPYSSLPKDLFGTSRYEIQQWDPKIADANDDEYIRKYLRDFSIDVPGEGFWVKPYGATVTYNFKTTYTDSTTSHSVSLYKGWNQIGYPFARAGGMPWSAVQVESATGTVKAMGAAIAAGWVDAEFWEYSKTGYIMRDTSSSIYPYKGYFFQVREDVKLKFDPNYSMPGGLARIVRPVYEWKMQLSASIDGADDRANYAGQLKGAARGLDRYDSGEPPTVDPFVSLYFEGGGGSGQKRAGRFSSNMKPPVDSGSESWDFVVETSEPGTMVALLIPNIGEMPENYTYKIKDNETGTEFDPRTRSEYDYLDSGSGIRRFTLTAKKTGGAELVTVSHEFDRGWSLFSTPLDPDPSDVREQLSDDLDAIRVFQYYDGETYDPNHDQMVDIQSGIGYWMYLEKAATLDFEGVLTDRAAPVEVPLVQGWNLIGNPYDASILFGETIEVSRGSEVKNLRDAAEAGWISPEAYGYSDEAGGYEKLEIGSVLEPWRGYAIKAYEQCTLIIRAGQ